ncbi:MAG: polyribonucleotide nucleotidyltransferase [Candidatus Eisenbacteria bacterium]|nr:polyribonucleotide nucleotidyltransferase [Candidatus Eisenbacteria bacterium]
MEKRARRERLDALEEELVAALEAEEEATSLAAGAGTASHRAAAGEAPRDEAPRAAPEAVRAPAGEIVSGLLREEVRRRALAGQRLDGRAPGVIRPIRGETALLPAAHGSAFFARGETHALATCTLGTAADEQLIEDLDGLRRERFLLHYNFPPYSVGEVRPLRATGRREIGHGHLARRALLPMIPDAEACPYTIRIESEITSSNGSSSMATVCAASLALMDAGVPLMRPVAGIAMGLISDGECSVILSDILGDEDHLGDMDFKVAGTAKGITAVQLDNKLGSLSRETLRAALDQAREGRREILARMEAICAAPRPEVPPHAPRVVVRRIRPARIRDLIGPGGRHIQELQQSTGVRIDVSDDGRVRIFAPPGAALREAEQRVRHLTGEPIVGRIYRGQVTGVTDFGCFVELFRGIEGLVHVSDLARERVEHPSAVAALGDEMVVKVLGVSEEGKIRLSRKAALGAEAAEIEG